MHKVLGERLVPYHKFQMIALLRVGNGAAAQKNTSEKRRVKALGTEVSPVDSELDILGCMTVILKNPSALIGNHYRNLVKSRVLNLWRKV